MERKLATVLFADLVDSTAIVSGEDPEVARRRVTRFFDQVSHCIETHGGTVEKFAGDAVMAAFGIPRAHEDDAERGARAALGIMESVRGLELEARIGLEAGEVVADETDSTFATGEAVNIAARLQQAAGPGQILVGPGVYRMTIGRLETEDVGPLELKGRSAPLWVWRVVGACDGAERTRSFEAPLIGREAELELLENTFSRAVRDRRTHLFTIYGDPGVGKSRLGREFTASLEGATILRGRCLPYGEGVTYWPLAEMVKASAGIDDDDPSEEAVDKLRACCEDEVVADLLALASGVLKAARGERSQQELAFAARAWAQQLAEVQPLMLVFEDIHWAEEPLLDLIEHLAAWVRDAPVLILCLARTELLDVRPGWGGGRVRATAIELEPLSPAESEELADTLLAEHDLDDDLRGLLLEKTEGNPLFVEETIRMLAEEEGLDGGAERIPDTLQALIAARIDLLSPAAKMLLQRAAVIGRIFWSGAVTHMAPELGEQLGRPLDDLLLREFLLEEPRSTISGERAYRFKHVLIREVAYSGLPKALRAEQHERFAGWLRERTGEELFEIRAYHLDQASGLHEELDGRTPPALAAEAAEALEGAARRALAREAYGSARKLALRASELVPTLERCYLAARVSWRLGDYPVVAEEMEAVRAAAAEAGDRRFHGKALTALSEVALYQGADAVRALELIEEALAVLEDVPDAAAHFEALAARSKIANWLGDRGAELSYTEQALAVAAAAGRKDLETLAALGLAHSYLHRLELDRAEPLIARARELADESGSIAARARSLATTGWLHEAEGELAEAEDCYARALELFTEIGFGQGRALALNHLGRLARLSGHTVRAERQLREAVRILKGLGDRGYLCESQRELAQVLAADGRLDEAEKVALEARETVGPQDATSLVTTTMALGIVRAAQGRDEEAEALLREALASGQALSPGAELEPLAALAQFLGERGRDDEAAPLEERIAEVSPSPTASAARMA